MKILFKASTDGIRFMLQFQLDTNEAGFYLKIINYSCSLPVGIFHRLDLFHFVCSHTASRTVLMQMRQVQAEQPQVLCCLMEKLPQVWDLSCISISAVSIMYKLDLIGHSVSEWYFFFNFSILTYYLLGYISTIFNSHITHF